MGFDSTAGIELDGPNRRSPLRPVGNDRSVPVSAGNGLSVSPGGVAAPRPVNPEVAVQISNLNARAQAAVASIPVSLVTTSMGKLRRFKERKKKRGGEDSDDSPSAAEQEIPPKTGPPPPDAREQPEPDPSEKDG